MHVHREIEILGIELARECHLRDHMIDLAVRSGPVHAILARGVGRVVDVDLGGGEAHILNLLDTLLGPLVSGNHLPRAGIGVDAHTVAHLAAEQLVHRQAQRFPREIPERGFDGSQRRHVLAGLRPGEHARGADTFERGLDVERVLPHEHAREGLDDRNVAGGRVGGFALPDDALIGVHPYVHLVAMHAHLGRADICDLEFGPVVWSSCLLHGGR